MSVTLVFRNVDASPDDPVGTWPYEALVDALERGLVQDWQPIFAEIRLWPWGHVARRVERIAADVESPGVASLFRSATRAAREESERRDREEVARRVRLSIRRSGLTAGQFAELIGTSASRLSTYTRGKVMPSAALLVRMERTAADYESDAETAHLLRSPANATRLFESMDAVRQPAASR